MKKETFVVDAALLRELGERLIGRSHIALAELVKNSYDADASTCRIEFGEGEIVISDDGSGMGEREFLDYWMRIGTTHKVEKRISSELGRPLTGSKGIGRLSVQFLADEMTLESTTRTTPGRSLYAYVDWRAAVSGKDLGTVNVLWEMRSETSAYPRESSTGTRITLKSLKSRWDAATVGELGDDIWMLRSPFRRTRGRTRREPDDFDVEIDAPGITGARDAFDERIRNVFANWKARIRGSLDKGRSGGKASISVEFKAGYPEGSDEDVRFRENVALPLRSGTAKEPLIDRVQFEILIFRPEGPQPGGIPVADLRKYLSEFGNVSVYDAGFRLPYYGSGRDATGQDWLSIAVDQGRRLNASELLPDHLRMQTRYMQDLPAPGRIFGAVNIDTNHERIAAGKVGAGPGEWLQIQPGRDRLHGNRAFDHLRDLVRFSLDFYANRFRVLSLEAIEKKREQEPPSRKFDRVLRTLDRNKAEIPAEIFREVRREVVDARKASTEEENVLDRRAALLAPLATAGMAALALSHEISRESRFLDRAGRRLAQLAKEYSNTALMDIAQEFADAKQRLEALQELFAPLLSDVDKAATERLRVRGVVETVIRSMKILMPRVLFRTAGIPKDLRFPLGSLAEWNALLQNVLSNAWNAMLDSAEAVIAFRGGSDGRGREWLHVSDTGIGVGIPLQETSKLFEPFERALEISEDKRSIAIGGQGLGLAIVRMIAHRRSAVVSFVEPEDGFATTFEISWRGGKK